MRPERHKGGNRLTSAFAAVLAGKPSVEEHSSIAAHNLDIPSTAGGFGDMANAVGDRARDDMSAFNFSRKAHMRGCVHSRRVGYSVSE